MHNLIPHPRIPMFHIFTGTSYTKNEKYMKKRGCNHIFHVFLIFRVVGSIRSMQHVEICN